MNKHDFKAQQKVEFMGNKGIITSVSPHTITIFFDGRMLKGFHTFSLNSAEFKQVKKKG